MSEQITILVIDDEENIRMLYQAELSYEEGYKVMTAESASEGLEILKNEKIDLVVLDIMMPEMDGLEMLEKIRTDYGNIPVILCTAYGTYKQDIKSMKADDYVMKSSNTTALKKSIRNILEKVGKIKSDDNQFIKED